MTIQFGDWQLRPMDSQNWQLYHRCEVMSGPRKGELDWHEMGRYYQWSSIDNALRFAADWEMKLGSDRHVRDIREALAQYQSILDGFLGDLLTVLSAAAGTKQGQHE